MGTVLEQFINQFKEEGKDHVRVGPSSRTQLGKILSLGHNQNFEIPGYGEFSSPKCFLNWLVSGDEEARFDTRARVVGNVRYYRLLLVYGKFFQMYAMRKEIRSLNKRLPIVAYDVLPTGIKQSTTRFESPSHITPMVRYIVDNPDLTHETLEWNWSSYGVDLLKVIQKHIDYILENGKGKHRLRKPTKGRKKTKEKKEEVKPQKEVVNEEILDTYGTDAMGDFSSTEDVGDPVVQEQVSVEEVSEDMEENQETPADDK